MHVVEADLTHTRELQLFLRRAWKEAGPGALGFTGATEETINEITSEKFLRDQLSNSEVKIFVAVEGSEIVGFASNRRIDSNTAELSGIMVLENATGKGIGTNLLKWAKAWAAKEGFHKILVKTEANNRRAINFYEKMGFSQEGTGTESVEGTLVELTTLQLKLDFFRPR